MLKNLRLHEKLKTKWSKLKTDYHLLKVGDIIPIFAKVNLSIKTGVYKLKKKIAKLILDTELSDKHHQL